MHVQVLLSIYVRVQLLDRAMDVMNAMQRLGLQVDIVFATWLPYSAMDANSIIRSQYSAADDFKEVLTVWKVREPAQLLADSSHGHHWQVSWHTHAAQNGQVQSCTLGCSLAAVTFRHVVKLCAALQGAAAQNNP